MELIIALVLFVGLIASWLVLPGASTTTVANTEAEAETTGLGRSVGQSA